jgi:hypothetical protein
MKKACPPHLVTDPNVESALRAKLQEGAFALQRSEAVLRRMNKLLAKLDADAPQASITPLDR